MKWLLLAKLVTLLTLKLIIARLVKESLTGPRTKAVTNRRGAINLSDDTGSAWITATMRNSNGADRGRTNVQRGKRATFATPGAEATYNYRLGLKKTNNTGGGTV